MQVEGGRGMVGHIEITTDDYEHEHLSVSLNLNVLLLF